MSKFTLLYKNLNKDQKQAVDTIEGPVMIIAGPGTGKTFTLTMRIANILQKTDTKPQDILALTFTESGVKAMREKLIKIIGSAAYYVNINTFHSFCTEIIKNFPEDFLLSEEVSPLSELERIQLFKDLISREDLDILRPSNSPYFYIHDLIRSIQNLKREGILPKDYKKIVKTEEEQVLAVQEEINPRTGRPYTKYAQEKRNLAKQQELLKIFISYQKELKKINRFDFEDMINLVVMKLQQNKNLKLSLQEKYLYLLVDEYQDTNSAQNEILKLLTDHWKSPNVFVVGDDEQSIYRFQGASVENILYFKHLFKNAEIITLTSNYRSSQCILDASRTLIEKNLLKIKNVKKTLQSKIKRKNLSISTACFPAAEVERQFIAQEIKHLLDKKVDPDEIAVLVRYNKDILYLKDYLVKQNIKFEIATGRDILKDGDIKKLLTLFRVICHLRESPGDDIEFFTLLNFEFLNLNKLDILKITRKASKKRINLLEAILDKDICNKENVSHPKTLITFVNKLVDWQALDTNITFTKFFETVINESGFLDWILSDVNNISRIKAVNALFDKIKELNYTDHTLNLAEFLNNLELMEENNIQIREQSLESDSQAVKLLTAHKAKGLEFEYVFIVECIDKKWGNTRNLDKIKLPEGIIKHASLEQKEKNEDERRLFYVALTRAKKKIYITFADTYSSNGYTKQTTPSMFITEIDKKFIKEIDTSNFEKKIPEQLNKQLKLSEVTKHEAEQEDFLKSLVDSLKLNVTALNTYLKCPYKFKLNTILRTPRAKASHLAFGTAIHKALEIYFQHFKQTEKLPPEKLLLTEFEKALEKEIMSAQEFEWMLKRGCKVLEEYYETNKETFVKPLYTEYAFGFRKVYLGDIPLSGKIDKIEWLDKEKKEVKVIDYKTGRPKTKGEIEGKTKYSDGDLLRQLLFYKLLSQLDRNLNFDVKQGEFDFLESKSGKKAKKEIFEYSVEQIEDLKTLIRKTMEQIKSLNFERTKKYHHCQNCDFLNHCWPEGLPTRSNAK